MNWSPGSGSRRWLWPGAKNRARDRLLVGMDFRVARARVARGSCGGLTPL